MTLTAFQAKYYAYDLLRRWPSDSLEKLAGAVAGAQVDLNPHQVDAALFAFQTPLARGALLADEVGLGKTIEAGLVVAQRWAERKRRILVITPANLRKQWHQELQEKFFLPSVILESRSYNNAIKVGRFRPFEVADQIVICSYQFARAKQLDVGLVPWDLVVIDEAHRLRNVYKPSNVIANALKVALGQRHKLLITATPLQNSLLELFGLVSFIDELAFGDLKSFREQYANLTQEEVFQALKARLRPICHRTLRRQVSAYVPFTQRHALVEEFTPNDDEDTLYELVSEYLARPNLIALPASQRTLTTLVLRKLLASSTFAIAGALASLSARLKDTLRSADPAAPLNDVLDEDYEALDETAEEWSDEEVAEPLTKADEAALRHEIADLEAFSSLATSIQRNAKGEALVKALRVGFAQAAELGAARKAIIFTESRRTQNYLLRRLADSEFAEGLVLFNGANTDERSRAIYAAWWERHRGTDRVTGSRSADMRSALVDYFRDEGRIMIATEAGAEGINLQFCSLVVNYDLPWNPQRIEQRIGRCHRYGQRHDVVVVNFINRRNEADKRVYELLRDKFKLFEGVFGASDEVLGAIESGVDIEKRIADIYQRCRRPEEIRAAFDQLQLELDAEISAEMSQTRRKLLDNFDDDVREKLRVRDADSKAVLSAFERRLMLLTRAELADDATFDGDSAFVLERCPFGDGIPLGRYELPRRSPDAHIYRLAHPLAQAVIERARQCQLPPATITFRYAEHDGKISILEPWLGSSGWLAVMALTVSALDQAEDYLIPVAFTDDGQPLDRETVERLLALPGRHAPLPSAQLDWGDAQPQLPSPDGSWGEAQATLTPAVGHPRLGELVTAEVQAITQGIAERNARFFEAEVEKLEGWADDLKLGLERDIKELDRRIKEARRAATVAATLAEKLEGQKQVRALEAERSQKRRSLFDAQDEVDQRRQGLIEAIEAKLAQETRLEHLFTVRWRLT